MKINRNCIVLMRGVNLTIDDSLGCIEEHNLDFGNVTCCIHAHVFKKAPYDLAGTFSTCVVAAP